LTIQQLLYHFWHFNRSFLISFLISRNKAVCRQRCWLVPYSGNCSFYISGYWFSISLSAI